MQKHGLFYTRSTLTATIISLSLAACRSRDKAPLWITSPKAWQRSDLTTSQRTPSSSTPSPRLLWVLFKPWGQDVQTAAGKWSESEMIAKCVDTCTPWSCAKWFPCLDLKNSDSLYIYIYILYSTIISFTISFKGRDWDCSSFTLNNYQTYFPICSRAKRRMSKKKQAHLNHGTSRSCDETVVWQSLKLLNKSSERKPASRITTRRCRVAI
jgi:hypothetical protein